MTDGYNHFSCPKFPAHSHWKVIGNNSVEVNFGKYGDYILNFSDFTHLVGHKKDIPANWRRCTLNRSITPADKADLSAHFSLWKIQLQFVFKVIKLMLKATHNLGKSFIRMTSWR